MKIVIDTNLLVSAFVFGGIVKKNLKEIFAEKQITIITSSAINAELKNVLFREKFRKFQARTYLEAEFAAFLANAAMIPITRAHLWHAVIRKTINFWMPQSADALISLGCDSR
ncbi:MAG: putative toxin-antitoxin system toxin component, PIN family [Candidatus Vecturithrix sp.]|jgi:putative PIN family toxin of toxin-antitoxin system|nr:putative toxin-antitoxin system toxin component, PIN family [Candidatus Vecturithrix sp.]